MVAQTRHGGQPTPTKLVFKEKLVAKSQTTDTYLRKLKALHHNLTELEQDTVEVASLATVSRDVILPAILLHSDRGVKAYAACCLVDLLNLYAPEAPYEDHQLVDIFKFLTVQLSRGLKSPNDTYFPQYFHVLESLSTVKSVVLICDLPNADGLITTLFRDFFALVRKDLSKQIESFMADIICALIDEASNIPPEAVDILLAQFTDKSADHPGHRLAVTVCKNSGDKLQPRVAAYFADVMAEHSEDEDLTEIRKAHELIKHIHASCPNLLHSVIPQLEDQCRTEDIHVRTLATETLADMYAEKGGTDLAKKYPGAFKTWSARMNDRVTSVRIKAIESSLAIVSNHAELRDHIESVLQMKTLDPDDKVRAAVSKLYGQVDFEIILHHVPRDHLQNLAARASDKKHSVRTETLKTLGKLYNLAYPLIENHDAAAVRQFSWIPNHSRPVVEQTIFDSILPLPSPLTSKDKSADVEVDEARWTDRLLTVMNFLEEDKPNNALLVATNLKQVYPTPYSRYLDACIANNGGVIDENEEAVKSNLSRLIKQHSSYFHDSAKAAEDFEGFAELNDQTLYKLLKKCMDPQTDVKTLVKRKEEFLKKLADKAVGIAATMKVFLRRATYHIINQSSIPTLLKRLEEGQESGASTWASACAQRAAVLLKYVSKHLPALFKAHQGLLTAAIASEEQTLLTATCLRALSCLIRYDSELASTDKLQIERYARYAVGPGEKHAKFAARLLCHTPNQSAACGRAVESLADSLEDASPDLLVAHISALAQFSLFAPDAFESKSDVITQFLVKQLLMQPSPVPEDEGSAGEEEWAADEVLPDLYWAKILALKAFRNRCRAYAGTDKASLVSEPALKMFFALLEANGSLSRTVEEDPTLMSRLRLTAALSLIQLASVAPVYSKAISARFEQLALVSQDTCYEVRFGFLTKVFAVLHYQKVPEVYNIIPFLTVHDPEVELRAAASTYITGAINRRPAETRTKFLGGLFIRFLHFLAHHPDFVETHKDLQDHSKYIRNYLELVATADNVPLLLLYAQKGKTVQDGNSQYNRNFWIMCELADEITRAYARSRKWPLDAYPGKIKLPGDIFKPPKSVQESNKTLAEIFAPEETIQWAKGLYGGKGGDKERKPAKRKAPATNGNGAKRSRKKRKSRASEEDDEDDGMDDEDDDEGTSRKATSDVEMGDPHGNDEADDAPSGEEQLGRGARQRAKLKAKRKAKAKS
ncbi:ARM repeat-containing protein [Hymenopellis radicata]|nr:ARM repeat-containing protein [Hymenopellis radicata]